MFEAMAFEKECDEILRILSTNNQLYLIEDVDNALKQKNINLIPNELLAIITILKQNNHIYASDQIAYNKVTGKYYGDVRTSPAGFAFITSSSYENEKERNDLILSLTVSNGRIQQSLLNINRWIALSALVAVPYYFHEMLKSYFASLNATASVILLIFGATIGILLYILLSEIINKKQK